MNRIALMTLFAVTSPAMLFAAPLTWTVSDGLQQFDNGVSPSVGLNSQGEVAVAHYAGNLKYSRLTSGGWVTETVDSRSQSGIHPSLAFDSAGVPHITYQTFPNFYYATRNNVTNTWSWEFAANYGVFNDLTFDSADRPHASLVGWAGDNTVYHTTKSSGAWSTTTVDDGAIYYYNSTGIALDASDYPHLVYSAVVGGNSEVRHSYQDGTGWHTEAILTGPNRGRGPSIDIDAAGKIHVTVFDDGNTDLLYVTNSGGTWSSSIIDSNARSEGHDWHARTALTLLPGDVPAVAYFDDILNELRFARKIGGVWETQVVDNALSVGETPSIIFGPNGAPIIAYHDDTRDLFKIAFADAEILSAPIPEPSTFMLAGIGGLLVTAFGRRQPANRRMSS